MTCKLRVQGLGLADFRVQGLGRGPQIVGLHGLASRLEVATAN